MWTTGRKTNPYSKGTGVTPDELVLLRRSNYRASRLAVGELMRRADADLGRRLWMGGIALGDRPFDATKVRFYRKQIGLVQSRVDKLLLGITQAIRFDTEFVRARQGSLRRANTASVKRYSKAMAGQFEANLRIGYITEMSQGDVLTRIVSSSARLWDSGPVQPTGYVRKQYWAERIVRIAATRAHNSTKGKQVVFDEVVSKYRRIAITGGPRAGKTTWAQRITDRAVIHTDDFRSSPWPEVPFLVIEACQERQAFCVEGVQVPRALRKGLEVDAVIWLSEPLLELSDGQERMRKGTDTIFRDWQATALRLPEIFHGEILGNGELFLQRDGLVRAQ